MSNQVLDPDVRTTRGRDFDSIYGRCPVCKKELQPVCINTGLPKAPQPGMGRLGRAKCKGCGNVIEYRSNGKWVLCGGN